jgi:hypothetical protein
MPTITLDISDEIAAQLDANRERLPELLALSLHQPAVPAQIYRFIVDFLAGNPSAQDLAAFGPTPEMQSRLQTLIERERTGGLTSVEQAELDEYERIEHLMVLIKVRNLSVLATQ